MLKTHFINEGTRAWRGYFSENKQVSKNELINPKLDKYIDGCLCFIKIEPKTGLIFLT